MKHARLAGSVALALALAACTAPPRPSPCSGDDNRITECTELADGTIRLGMSVDGREETFTPRVVVLLESTPAMREGPWGDMVRRALVDPMVGLAHADGAAIGVALYSGDPDAAAVPGDPRTAEGTCLTRTMAPSAFDNAPAIEAAFDGAATGESAPTAEAIADVAAVLAELGPAAIVVVTAGEPESCRWSETETSEGLALGAAQLASAAGIRTYVIGVGSQGSDYLQALADAGAGVMGAEYALATDEGSMLAALTAVVDSERECIVRLPARVDPTRTTGTLSAGRSMVQTLVQKDPNGWRVRDESHIELLGTACELVREDPVTLFGHLVTIVTPE